MGGWISVEERLPDIDEGDSIGIIVQLKTNNLVCEGVFHGYVKNYKKPEVQTRFGGKQFVEWQPFPEPK